MQAAVDLAEERRDLLKKMLDRAMDLVADLAAAMVQKGKVRPAVLSETDSDKAKEGESIR